VGVPMIPGYGIIGRTLIYFQLHAVPFWACPACEFCEET
jgi:hypothetical protein